jgi:DNA-binding MarR family transcriptional regulator
MNLAKLKDAAEKFREETKGDAALRLFIIFTSIAAKPGVGQQDLVRDLDVPDASVSRPVNMLAKEMGLVQFVPDPEDYRIKRLYLTPKGEQLKAKLNRIIE